MSWLEDESPSYPILSCCVNGHEHGVCVHGCNLSPISPAFSLSLFLHRENKREMPPPSSLKCSLLAVLAKYPRKRSCRQRRKRSSFDLWMDQGFKNIQKTRGPTSYCYQQEKKRSFCKTRKRTVSIMVAHSFDPLAVFSSPFYFGAF